LGHLTYVCKSVHNPSHGPVPLAEHRELTDEILKLLVKKGKGLEVNTSGVDRAGAFLPDASFLRRFRELGGQIVTVGSDAHDPSRVGQYAPQAMQMLQDIFGHVCTYENRQPVFHKL
jgi:histidinol-phosphatase (PHP family)